MTASAITVVDQAFAVLVAQPAPLVFDARDLPALPESQRRLLGLDELRRLLLAKTLTGTAVDAVWRRLGEHARDWGPQWVVGAVGVAAPALTRMAAALAVGRAHRADDIDAEVVAGFLAGLRTADLERPRLWLRLTWAAWRAGHHARRTDDVAALPDELPGTSTTPQPPWGHPDLVLARAAAAGILTRHEAALIGDTRLGGTLIDELADQQGVSPAALRMRRVRAERRLVTAIRNGEVDEVASPATATRDHGARAGTTASTIRCSPQATSSHTQSSRRSASREATSPRVSVCSPPTGSQIRELHEPSPLVWMTTHSSSAGFRGVQGEIPGTPADVDPAQFVRPQRAAHHGQDDALTHVVDVPRIEQVVDAGA